MAEARFVAVRQVVFVLSIEGHFCVASCVAVHTLKRTRRRLSGSRVLAVIDMASVQARTPKVLANALSKAPTGIDGFRRDHRRRPAARPHHAAGGRPGFRQDHLRAAVPGARRAGSARSPASSSPSRRPRSASSPTAESFGWDLAELRRKKLFFLDAQPTPDLIQSGDFDLGGMLAALECPDQDNGGAAHRVRRARHRAGAAARRGGQTARDLPAARLAAGARTDRHHHRQGRRRRGELHRPAAVRLHAVHGRLRRDPQPPRGAGRLAAQPARAEVSRLELRRERIAVRDRQRAASTSPSRARSAAWQCQGQQRARLQRRGAARHHARRRLLPRCQRADHRLPGHRQDDPERRLRRGRLRARRAHPVRQLRLRRHAR